MVHYLIRVVIADDHAFVRSSLRRVIKLEPRLSVVAEAENGSEAVALVEKNRPDLVVMDISMPVMNGIEATGIITSKFPDTKVIVLTAHTDERYLNSAYQAGASHCLAKTCGTQDILDAIMDCVFSR
jgi:two-component system, NarL family, response regulator DegU